MVLVGENLEIALVTRMVCAVCPPRHSGEVRIMNDRSNQLQFILVQTLVL